MSGGMIFCRMCDTMVPLKERCEECGLLLALWSGEDGR
jgi:hypothetical protein